MAMRHPDGGCANCGERTFGTATGGEMCLNCDPPEREEL